MGKEAPTSLQLNKCSHVSFLGDQVPNVFLCFLIKKAVFCETMSLMFFAGDLS